MARQKTGRNSDVIQARLNKVTHKEALEVFYDLRSKGYSQADIVASGLLLLNEEKMIEFHNRAVNIETLHEDMETLKRDIASQFGEILKTLRDENPDALRRFTHANIQGQEPDAELDDEFLINARDAIRKTHKQRGQGS